MNYKLQQKTIYGFIILLAISTFFVTFNYNEESLFYTFYVLAGSCAIQWCVPIFIDFLKGKIKNSIIRTIVVIFTLALTLIISLTAIKSNMNSIGLLATTFAVSFYMVLFPIIHFSMNFKNKKQ